MFGLTPRFSLSTVLLTTALVGSSIALWQVLVENRQLERRVQFLQNELGYLNVHDPTSAYVREMPGGVVQGHYRVYLPGSHRFALHVAVKQSGQPEVTTVIPHHSGRLTVRVHVLRSYDYQKSVPRAELMVSSAAGSRRVPLAPKTQLPSIDWFGVQRECDPNEPIILLEHSKGDSSLAIYFATHDGHDPPEAHALER